MASPKALSEIRFEEFPDAKKGLFCLRWIDGVDVHGRGLGAPIVHSHLSPISLENGGKLPPATAVIDGLGSWRYPIPAGMLSTLRLGTVFKGGRVVGLLDMTPRSYKFERQITDRRVVQVGEESPAKRPDWWKWPWRTLPRQAYRLDNLLESNCLVLTTGNVQLILPASEVFRVFCGPELLLANALLSGPWDVIRHKAVNETWSEKHAGFWEIGLRKGLTALSALPIAAFEMTNFGRSVAGFIQSTLIGNFGKTKSLYADIPYEWDEMEIDVEGVPFPAENAQRTGLDRFIGLRITGVRWPKPLLGFPARIIYRLDNYNTEHVDPSEADGVKKAIPIFLAPLPDDAAETIPLTLNAEASALSQSVKVELSNIAFKGGPTIERMELSPSEDESPHRTSTFIAGSFHAASATPQRPSSDGAAPLWPVAEPREERGDSYSELIETLEALAHAQKILGWTAVQPIDDRYVFQSRLPVWLFPAWSKNRRRAWSYISGSKRRTALVVRIRMAKDVFYLVEIERRFWREGLARESFSLLLLEMAESNLQRVISSLLRECADVDGVWSKAVVGSSSATLLNKYLIRQHPSSKRQPKETSRRDVWNLALLAIFSRFVKTREASARGDEHDSA
jgi:hypothetical protein